MTPEHQKTLFQTIQARLERDKNGTVTAVYDPDGPWSICERTSGGLITYFKPAHSPNYDIYGNIITKPEDEA